MRLNFTLATIRSRCLPPAPNEVTKKGNPVRQRSYWDTKEPGLGLVVRRPRKEQNGMNATFIFQRDVDGKTYKVTIGRFGTWTVDQARKRTRELRQEMDQDDWDGRGRARRVTLAQALQMHLDGMVAKECTESSLRTVRYEVNKYLADWLDRPLARITGEECRSRHRHQTRNCGPYVANRVMRHVRALYRTAARVHKALPRESPTTAVAFNKERRRRQPIPWLDVPTWWEDVHGLPNPVRRDLNLFVLFTGLRSTDARTVRWEDVDFGRGTIHRPRPKGGEDRAFTVPLPGFALELLRQRREENRIAFGDDGGWAFPSRKRGGDVTHVQQSRELRYEGNGKQKRKVRALPSLHRLRNTFATAAHEARVHPMDLKLLMNHVLPISGDVTEGYVRPSVEHLRECVEKVAAFLLETAGVGKARKREVG